MTRILVRVLILAAAFWVATLLVPGIHVQASIVSFLIVASVFGLVNTFVRPVARILSLPVRLLTLGLFSFVINALMLMLTDRLAGDALSIDGGFLEQTLWALVASFVISVTSTLIGWVVPWDD